MKPEDQPIKLLFVSFKQNCLSTQIGLPRSQAMCRLLPRGASHLRPATA